MVLRCIQFYRILAGAEMAFLLLFFCAWQRHLIPGSGHLIPGSAEEIPVSGGYGNWLARD
jgi:hypothetical protein